MVSQQGSPGGTSGQPPKIGEDVAPSQGNQASSEGQTVMPTYGLTRPEVLQLLDHCPDEFTTGEVLRIWSAIAAGSITEEEVRTRCPAVLADIADLQEAMAEMAAAAGRQLKVAVAGISTALQSVVEGARASGERMRQQVEVAAVAVLGPPAEVRLLQAVRDQTTRQAEILIESAQQIALLAESGRAALDGLRTLEGLAGATVQAIEQGQKSADRAAARLTKLTWALVALTGFLGLLTLVLVVLTIVLVVGGR
jgi:hypothetical protein